MFKIIAEVTQVILSSQGYHLFPESLRLRAGEDIHILFSENGHRLAVTGTLKAGIIVDEYNSSVEFDIRVGGKGVQGIIRHLTIEAGMTLHLHLLISGLGGDADDREVFYSLERISIPN